MKKLLVLSLFLVGCVGEQDGVDYKVHFGDKVRVTKGFYKGTLGITVDTCIGAGMVRVDVESSLLCEHQDNLEVIK